MKKLEILIAVSESIPSNLSCQCAGNSKRKFAQPAERLYSYIPMRISLRLYITSSSPQSAEALSEIEQVKSANKKSNFDLEVVDVLENPTMAEKDQISVTPTLIILSPLPVRKIISDFKSLNKELGFNSK